MYAYPSAQPLDLTTPVYLAAAPKLAQMARNQEPESKYTDSSEPLFKLYCKMTEHHHEKVEVSLKSVDNIVFFVRASFFYFPCQFTYQVNITDGPVFCGRCRITCVDSP
jgi:hypothetical protein